MSLAQSLPSLNLRARNERATSATLSKSQVGHNPKFNGLYDEVDPRLGGFEPETSNFSIPDHPVRSRLEGIPRFIRGGDCFFLASVRASRFLASLS
jgi:hypothetical protein